jgi:hypothetical protein
VDEAGHIIYTLSYKDSLEKKRAYERRLTWATDVKMVEVRFCPPTLGNLEPRLSSYLCGSLLGGVKSMQIVGLYLVTFYEVSVIFD